MSGPVGPVGAGAGGSKLAPSKSTVYVSNLPFTFTNNDLHKIFEQYGKVVKVTVVKDKARRSKGVAFVLYLERESAYAATRALNNKQMFGRMLKCSIAKDNGRAPEFIKRRDYVDKSRCYECGESGHLSYMCPSNALGEREPPKKKQKKKKKYDTANENYGDEEEEEEVSDEGEDPALESLSAAISFQRQMIEEEEYRVKVATGNYSDNPPPTEGGEDGAGPTSSAVATASGSRPNARKRTYKKSYFSDDEEEEEVEEKKAAGDNT